MIPLKHSATWSRTHSFSRSLTVTSSDYHSPHHSPTSLWISWRRRRWSVPSVFLNKSTCPSAPPCVYFQPISTRQHVRRHLPVFTFNPPLHVNMSVGTSLCLLSTHLYTSTCPSAPPCVYFQPTSTRQHVRRHLPVFTFNPPLHVNMSVGTSLCLLSTHLYTSACPSAPPCVYFQPTSTRQHVRRHLPVFTFNPPLHVNMSVGTSLCLLSTHLYPSTCPSAPPCVYFQPASTRQHVRRHLPVFSFNPPLPVNMSVGISLCLLSTHLYPSTCPSAPPCVYFQPTSTRQHVRRHLPVFTFNPPLPVNMSVGISLCLLSTHLYPSTCPSAPPCVYFQPTSTRQHVRRHLPVFTFNPPLPVNMSVGTFLCFLSTLLYTSTYTSAPPCVTFHEPTWLLVCRLHT